MDSVTLLSVEDLPSHVPLWTFNLESKVRICDVGMRIQDILDSILNLHRDTCE